MMLDLKSLTPSVEPRPDWIDERHDALLSVLAQPGSKTPWLPRPRIAVPVGMLALASALTFAIVVGSPQQPQLASWTATPQPVSETQSRGFAERCRAGLPEAQFGEHTSLTPAVAERRGRYLAVLLSGQSGWYGFCVGSDRSLFAGIGRWGPATDAALVLDGQPGIMNGPGMVRIVTGRVTSTVTRVVIKTSDSREVTASLSGGHFFAWWPSGADPLAITGYNAAGAVVGTIHPRPQGPVPSPEHS